MKNGHVKEWISRYMDGELPQPLPVELEGHLLVCDACRAELEATRRLSGILQAYQVPARRRSPNQAALSIERQLSQPQSRPIWERGLRLAWQAAPFALIMSWAFTQAILFLSNLVLLVAPVFGGIPDLDLNLANIPLSGYFPLTSLASWALDGLASLPYASSSALIAFGLGIASTAFTLVLFGSWLAGWWISRQNVPAIHNLA